MTRTQNFFRKYILSTLRILALFLLVNALLICLFLLIFYLEGASKSQFPIEKFSSLIENNNNHAGVGRRGRRDRARYAL